MKTGQQTVLVVEDDENLAVGLRFALEREGYEVVEAGSLSLAAEVLASRRIDIVLLDVGLPDGDGAQLCRSVRAGEFTRRAGAGGEATAASVPIIFLTARDDEVDVVRGLELGGDDYVTKPFRLGELISRIRARLRSSIGVAPSATSRGGEVYARSELVIDSGKAEVTRSGSPVPLTAGEYRLLLLLVRNEGMVMTRESLIAGAIGIDGGFADANTLSVYVRRLREKIEIDPSSPRHIVTVRGVGYRFEG